MREIEVPHVASPDRLEDFADAIVEFRRCQQMNIVGHPDMGMNGQAMLIGRFYQDITKELIVGFIGKDRLPVVAALDDVLWLTGNGIARKAGHGGSHREMM